MKVSCRQCGSNTRVRYRLNKTGLLLYAVSLAVILVAIAVSIGFPGFKGYLLFVFLVIPPLVLLRRKFDKYVSCMKCGAFYSLDKNA